MKRLLYILVLALISVAPVQALAAEEVSSFSSKAVLSSSGELEVVETITYDFGDNNRHGIFRKVPIKYPAGDGKSYYPDFDLKGVEQDGRPAEVEEERNGDYKQLRIGDPDATISGQHTYVIRYMLSPAAFRSDSGALVNYNVTGNEWEVPIRNARFQLELPSGVSAAGARCFVGEYGARDEASCPINGTAATVTRTLAPGEGMTMLVDLPASAVSNYLEAKTISGEELATMLLSLGIMAAVASIIGSVVALTVLRKRRASRRRKNQTVIAEYEAPSGLTAGEVGYVIDDSSDMKEITATLIDLAVRGYIKVVQTRAKGFMKSAQYQLIKLRDFADVQDYEAALLAELFKKGDTVAMHEVDRASMSTVVAGIHSTLKKRLQDKDLYFERKDVQGFWNKLVEDGTISDAGAGQWAKVAGFKLYLSVAEKDRLNFTDAPERTPERFSKLLPFAVALGVEKEWAKQFEGIDVAPATGWYAGSGGYTQGLYASSFVGDFSSDFGSSVNSAFVAPSSSGSGGGFSGGGVGGGGGGSW